MTGEFRDAHALHVCGGLNDAAVHGKHQKILIRTGRSTAEPRFVFQPGQLCRDYVFASSTLDLMGSKCHRVICDCIRNTFLKSSCHAVLSRSP